MGRTAYNTKIVKGQLLIEPVDDIGDLMAQLIDLRIIGDDRVHMDDSTAGKLLLQLALYVINQIVQLHKAALGIDLRMQGDHPPSGTVIVNEQVVNAHDLWMGKHNAADFCDKLRVGSLTEQRIDGIPGRAYAGIKKMKIATKRPHQPSMARPKIHPITEERRTTEVASTSPKESDAVAFIAELSMAPAIL